MMSLTVWIAAVALAAAGMYILQWALVRKPIQKKMCRVNLPKS